MLLSHEQNLIHLLLMRNKSGFFLVYDLVILDVETINTYLQYSEALSDR